MHAEYVTFSEIVPEEVGEFQPFACFDKHMDCIRVFIVDASVKETRLNEFFTVATINSGFNCGGNAGFTIKGVAHLFETIGLNTRGVHTLVEILDKIVKKMPHTTVKKVFEEFAPILNENQVIVDFEESVEAVAS